MNQRLLTNFSLIVIKYVQEQQEYCMGSESFLRSEIFLSNDQTESNFENYLFYAQSELDSNYDFKNSLQFQQEILFRHKVSNKFLSYLVEYGDDENDSIIKIQLSDKPCYFKILPCFQYQTKISSKVKFNQDIYIATELNSAKLGYVNVRQGEHQSQLKTIFSLNQKSKLVLHSYFQLEKEEKQYIYGQAVWIKHVESRAFVTVFRPETDGVILYEQLQVEDDLQSINGLWVIESTKIQVGGILSFHEAFYLKSLSTNKYLSFDPNFTIVNGENIFKLILVNRPNQFSRFQFLSLKGEQNKIKKGSYLIFKHQKTGSYIGTRKIYSKHSITHYQPTTFNQFEDEDLFDLLQLQKEQEQAIRFICSIKKQLKIISQILKRKEQILSRRMLSQFQCLYGNIIGVLKKLQNDRLFNEVKQQMSSSIQFFCEQLKLIKQRIARFPQISRELVQLVKHIYTIFQIICKNYKDNQVIAYKYIYEYVDDIFKDFGAEELLCEIFSHNYSLLCKVPNKIQSIGNCTIISVVLRKINQMKLEKEKGYWMKVQKLLNFLETTLQYRQKIIDINQRLISTQLFQIGYFNSIFFQIKIFNQRVRMLHPQQNKWIQIQQISDKIYIVMLQRIFHLFSMLCQNRNFISKQFINKYFNQLNKDGIKVMISYLNIPISVKLANSMLSLITNCYIDSAPRINRYKPLAVLNFSFSDDDSVASDKPTLQSNLKETLLNKGEKLTKYQSNSWKVSNTLQGLHSDEPGLNEEQLDMYKTQLNEKIRQNQWSKQLLRSVCTLMRLQSYTSEQIQQIQKMLISNMMDEVLDNDIMAQTMYIFQELHVYKQQLQLKKITAYLKYKFSQSNSGQLQKQDIKYYISHKLRAKSAWSNTKDNQNSAKTEGQPQFLQQKGSSKKYRRQYNHILDKLKVFSPSNEIKQKLLNTFINNEKYPFSILSAIFKTILNFYSPQLTMVKLLTKSIILTHDQVQNFQQIFKFYKKIKHLTSIGQYWLSQSLKSQSNQSKVYYYTMLQFTNYLYEDYVLESQTDRRFRKNSKISINRQLLILNLAVHQVSLEFISTNMYLLENKMKNQVSEKVRKVFQINFQFLYYFCQNCVQNLEVVTEHLDIIARFENLPEVGQTKLLILLYKQSSNLIKQIRFQTIQKIICKIIQSPLNIISTNQCQYSPQYSQLLLTICFYKQKIYKKNLQLIFQIIQKQSVLLKLLYTDPYKTKSLCLDANQFKSYPLQVPILYHRNVIKIFNLLFLNLESTSSSIKFKIREIINIDSLLRILALPDLYSHKGTIPELYFLLKKEVFVLLKIYLEKTDNLIKLYQSEALHDLLAHFMNIFLINKEKQAYTCQKEILYLPYIQPYLQQIKYFKQNQRDFYQQYVQPLLTKLLSLFQKYMNKDSNKSYQKLIVLIQNINIRELNQDHLLKNQLNGMDLLKLKWRNFVDSDDDNSQEEKFVKKIVLEILRNQESYKMIEVEKISFFKTIKQNQEKYFSSMSKLIEMASQEENHGSKSDYLLFFYQIIRNLAEYFVWITNQDKEKRKWDGEKLATTLIGYVTREEFQYNNTISRKTFFQILRILVFLLENDTQLNLTKELYKMFVKNISCFRFFNCLRDSINEISQRVIGDKAHQQINEAISELYICGQERKCSIDKQALKLIALLCKHIPFTQFFRSQPYNSSIDFLDKIYNSFYFTAKRPNTKNGLAINVTTVDITESIMDCIIAMMNGCNKSNQNFIIDNKYPQIVVEVLKIDEISEIRSKAQLAKRDRLLQEICNFYLSNGINIEQILNDKIKVMDFSHSYLLSRFKYTLFKIIIQAALANPRGMSKLRILIPIELLKINLIWIYEDYKKQGLLFTEEDILRVKEPWEKIVQEKSLNSVFLMVGFYFFQLIQHNNQVEKQSNQQQGQSALSEQKQKQKIVRKFFSSISQVQKKQQRIQSLQKQYLAEQMKMFYDKYYQAYQFFKSKNVTVQANIYGNLIKLFFPKIPICDKITEQFEDKLIQQAQRISHQQKIKSLMSFEKESYEYLQGEEDYFNQMGSKSTMVGKIVRFVEDQQKIFLFVWLISVLIVLCYLIDDFSTPSTNFLQEFGSYFIPTSVASVFILILSMINLICGFILLVNMIFRKIPFFLRLYQFKYNDQLAEQGKMDSSLGTYQFKNIISSSFYDIYTIIFSILSIMHPLFAGFLLIYIVKRIAIGRQIVRAIEETWFNLLIAVALLIVFNYIYSIFIYSATFTDDIGYGTTCMTLSTCLKMLVDQSLKGGSGFFSYVDANYNNIGFSFKIVCQITYILFAQKVISEIFSGTIIDKFGELREEGDSKEEDQKSSCFICGQQRFQIDFQLQGFQQHIQNTHNKMNYIYYLFYLRRKSKKQYGVEQGFVWNCHQKMNNQWVPDQTSILKQKKEELQQNQNEDNYIEQYQKFYQKKLLQFKKMHVKVESMSNIVKEQNFMI